MREGFFDNDADIEQSEFERSARAIARCSHEYLCAVPDDYPDWLRLESYRRCDDCGSIVDTATGETI